MAKGKKKSYEGLHLLTKSFPGLLSFGRQLILQKGAKVRMTQRLISIKFTTSSDAFLEHFAVFTQK